MRLLFLGEDPGGVDVIVPLYKRLAAEGTRGTILSRGPGKAVWQRHGIEFADLGEQPVDDMAAARWLGETAPSLLISATSFPGRLEKIFRKAARQRGIPTLTVMDADRSDHYVTSREEQDCRGDYVLSISDRMTRCLIEAGYAPERVITTGHLGLGQIAAEGCAWPADALADWTASFRVCGDGRALVTIFSDNLSEVFGADGALAEIGYHERDVVPQIVAAIRHAAEVDGRQFEVVIKLHPKEQPDKFERLARSGDGPVIVRIVRDCANVPLILASERIFGMYSIVLVWSAVLGKPVLSIQPGARKRTFLATAHEGRTPALWTNDGLYEAVARFLLDDDYYAECVRMLEGWRPPREGLDIALDLIRCLAKGSDTRTALSAS